MIDRSKRGLMQVKDVRNFLDSVLEEDIHTKRIVSLANATLGVMTGASLGVAVIGKSLAQARGLLPKHAVKQVDRLLSNPVVAQSSYGFSGAGGHGIADVPLRTAGGRAGRHCRSPACSAVCPD